MIKGGGGVWGDHAMNAHPQLSKEDASEIVKYVLSLANQSEAPSLPQAGIINFTQHKEMDTRGRYFLTASYKDQGGAITPLASKDVLTLRPAKLQAEETDDYRNLSKNENDLGSIHHKSYFVFKQIDLKGIRSVTYRYSSKELDATLEIHAGSAKGPVISTLNYKNTGDWNSYKEVTVPVKSTEGKNDLYFVFKKEQTPNRHMFSLDWIEFKR